MLSLSSPKALESTNGRTQKFDFDSSQDVFFSENFIEAYIDEINEKTQQLMLEERKKRKNSNRSRSSVPTRHSMISFNQITSQSFLQTTAVKSAMHLENQRTAQKWLSQKASGVSPQKLNSKTSVIGPFEFFELIKNKGLQVIKHPRKGNPRKMFIRMSRKDSEKSLVWRGRSFLKRRFDLASANNIQKGFTTSIFQRTGDPTQDGRYVSIENSQRMLCLEMSSEIERNNFVKLVEFLAKGHSPIEQISLQTNSNPQLKITYNSKNASG